MKKKEIKRGDIIEIVGAKYVFPKERPIGCLEYNKWLEFIKDNKDLFVWYEDTEDGVYRKNNLDEVPQWALKTVLDSLNRTIVYGTSKIVRSCHDLIIKYDHLDGIVSISIEKKMTKEVASILLRMARSIGGKLVINGTYELECIEQLE
ncbi:uncharacterized protein BN460_00270 [Porphyromonas sp. CAG:1061]|uniref:hypothetical protein n=1 Tax=Porphyromonas sp. CAG:1061 TaxID=1262916 RepID=UPI0003395FA2|nr:hypothetical protein [Porphyromonas sp. CAG:1061]CCY12145.1 uncharacterized protein BN460_00270 [Porphyromonas sp. CAG:1061]